MADDAPRERDTHTWQDEIVDLLRGVSGGMLLGIPLLYTAEVWRRGAELTARGAAVTVVSTFVPVAALMVVSGFRRSQVVRWGEVLTDAVEALAIAAVCVVVTLFAIGEIGAHDSLRLGVGKVVAQLAPFAIGVALSSMILSSRNDDDNGNERPVKEGSTLADLASTAIGATVIGLSIAPTGEVPHVVAGLSPPGYILLVVTSLAVSYVIVFEAGFGDQEARTAHPGLLQHPLTETAAAYLVALIVSFGMLCFFGAISLDDPPRAMIEHVMVLGLPACVGGAAGRLAV